MAMLVFLNAASHLAMPIFVLFLVLFHMNIYKNHRQPFGATGGVTVPYLPAFFFISSAISRISVRSFCILAKPYQVE